MRLRDDRRFYTAPCGIRRRWPSRRRNPLYNSAFWNVFFFILLLVELFEKVMKWALERRFKLSVYVLVCTMQKSLNLSWLSFLVRCRDRLVWKVYYENVRIRFELLSEINFRNRKKWVQEFELWWPLLNVQTLETEKDCRRIRKGSFLWTIRFLPIWIWL